MRLITKGATSQTLYVEILDSTSTTGARKTGLAFNTASLVGSYVRNGAARTAITLATQTAAGAWSSGGFVEVDATNVPGIYRLDVPDAAFASGADSVVVTLKGATGMVQVSEEVQLVAISLQDAVRAGMTALPNAAAEAAGGLYTRGSGAGQINQNASGQVDSRTVTMATDVITAAAIQADAIGAAEIANGAIDAATFAAGAIDATAFAQGAADKVWSSATRTLTSLTALASQIADAVWNAVATSYNTALSMGNKLNSAASAGDPWTTALPGAYGAGTAGNIVGNNLDATVSSRLPTVDLISDSGTAQAGAAGTITLRAGAVATDNFYNDHTVLLTGGTGAGQTRRIVSYVGATKVATIDYAWATNPSVTSTYVLIAGVRVRANAVDDKSNYQLATGAIVAATFGAGAIDAAAIATDALGALELAAGAATEIAAAVWDEARASHTAAGSFGQGVASVQGNVTGSAASVSGAVGSVTGAVGSVTGAVGSVTGNVGGNVVGSVGSVSGAVGSVTGNVGGNVTGSVGSVAAGGITASSIAADAIGASELAADAVAEIAAAVSVGSAPTAAQNAAAVWDQAISGHTTSGTFGNKVNGLSSGGSGGPVGSGSTAYTVTVTRPDGVTPIEGVAVWVSTDAAGTNVVAGTLYTDTLGRINSGVGFMLDPGNYYLWRQTSSWIAANPTAITVT